MGRGGLFSCTYTHKCIHTHTHMHAYVNRSRAGLHSKRRGGMYSEFMHGDGIPHRAAEAIHRRERHCHHWYFSSFRQNRCHFEGSVPRPEQGKRHEGREKKPKQEKLMEENRRNNMCARRKWVLKRAFSLILFFYFPSSGSFSCACLFGHGGNRWRTYARFFPFIFVECCCWSAAETILRVYTRVFHFRPCWARKNVP